MSTKDSAGKPTALVLAEAALQAYVNKDRAAIEALIADDFSFTSPLDNALDRATYFRVCWPNSAAMDSVTVEQACDSGERAFLIYEATAGGKRFRNCEMHTARSGKLISVEVYFGWDLAHPASPGSHIDPSAGSKP